MTILDKTWLKAAIVRAIKTFAQSAASLITVGALVSEINWKMVFSTALVALVYSLLTSLGGLPEVSANEPTQIIETVKGDE